MNKSTVSPIILCLCLSVSAGCSNPTPAAPTAVGTTSELSAKPSTGTAGVLTLTFMANVDGTLQEVTSLPVATAELILKAYVASSTGGAAQAGTVTFEYCSFKGRPNDVNRADEAPREACDLGTASWSRIWSSSVNAGTCPGLGTGYACVNFGVVSIPRDVGFRFRYASRGSGIASGTSPARDFTWTAAQ